MKKPVFIFQHVPHEGPGALGDFLQRRALPHRPFALWKNPTLPAPTSARALVILGGPMGVYELNRWEFLGKEIDFVSRAARGGVPVLGICLGAQILARALGTYVYPNPDREIGWYDVALTAEGRRDPLFKGAKPRHKVFQWHGDTFDLPAGARRLASSPLCRNQAFRWKNALGLQYHLEVTPALIDEWLAQPGVARELHFPQAHSAEKIRRDTQHFSPALAALGDTFFHRFFNGEFGSK